MKAIILLILFLPILAFAENKYSFSKIDEKYFLNLQDQKWEIKFQAQEPKILEIKTINDQTDLIIYKAEEAGTKYIIQMDKAIIIDTKKKKLISQEPLDYKYTNLKSKEIEAEASYQVKDKKVIWKFEDEQTILNLESSSN